MENKINFNIDRKLTEEESAALDIVKKLQNKGIDETELEQLEK